MQVSADEMHTALIDIISDNRYVRIVKTINTSQARRFQAIYVRR